MINYLIAMATFGAIYAILALGLNVMWGMAGMVNLGIVGFYAFGAYITALLTVKAHAPIALGFFAAMIGTAIMGALVTLGLTRLRDDYLAIVTDRKSTRLNSSHTVISYAVFCLKKKKKKKNKNTMNTLYT